MNLLPLDSPKGLEIAQELGAILATYEANAPSDDSRSRIKTLEEKVQGSEAKAIMQAIGSLMSRNVPLSLETLKADVETERHYLDLSKKVDAVNEKKLKQHEERLASVRNQLKVLQSKKQHT